MRLGALKVCSSNPYNPGVVWGLGVWGNLVYIRWGAFLASRFGVWSVRSIGALGGARP